METKGKPLRCRAAVCRNAGEALKIEEVIVAPPKTREVRIKIICTSLCHSDIIIWKMADFPGGLYPRIFGHEAVGVVESLGENVTEVKKGDIVVPTFISDCRECKDCLSTKSNLCSKFASATSPWMPRDMSSRFTNTSGEVMYHFINVSSFSEYTVVDIAHITKIDSVVSPDKVCLLSCGVATGVGAAWKTANVEPGSSVAIFGMGTVGLAVAEGPRISGATKIIGVDVNPHKFELGKKFGVTDFVNPRECDNKPSEVIKKMTDGGADYCFESVGSASLVYEAFCSCRKGWGKTIVVGVDPKSELKFGSYELLHSGKTIMGSRYGNLKPKTDIPLLLKRYENKEINLDDFLTHQVGFEEINKAFDLLLGGES
ncbi:hypothetical protein ACHQM5_015904 [Ranunculus cassubicifolius]